MVLYVWIDENDIRVGTLDPDGENDYGDILAESFIAAVQHNKRLPEDIAAGIVRNVLANGGAIVIMR